ncbi:class I SAM-dependent methyltransferase [Marinilabiliaceae bacterium JC017]|nr:class I SAM-dependent methyltransferase [Marinilabiliaceae bacterium JC017]
MVHREIIKNKKFLKNIYEEWYDLFLAEIADIPNNAIVELGSGGGFFKEKKPDVICTDIIDLPTNDLTISALDMPFENNTVGGIFMIDTMHHIPDSEKFLQEVDRVLVKKGKMVMIEPANSLWGRFIYKNFHHEPFAPSGSWTIPSTGPLSGANGALPWIVFIRDNERFKQKFPNLKIESIEFINPLTYLLSGGVSRHQLLPDFTYPAIKGIDRLLSGISKELSMFMVVKVSRT